MNQKNCLDTAEAGTSKALEVLDLARSHTGRAFGLFSALGILPGVSWHDAAIAALSISAYALWQRCQDEAQPGEAGADVLLGHVNKRVEWVAPRLAPALAKVMARIKGAIQAQPRSTEVAIEVAPSSHTEPVLPAFAGKSGKSAIAG